jgi:hypothetical protein
MNEERKNRQTTPKPGGEPRCSGRVGSSCSTSGTRRVNLVTNLAISHEWRKNRQMGHIKILKIFKDFIR